ncbi:hypothetical protein ADK70_15705 [Streptomyces rimosus subsp. pseudoverticillatus]|uniref:substrate-binding domain-containing protein n=1 Tax=Streptomyces rimosus TaxID=1927 RepID=UPI0006B268E2|nr:substrate-binding domain-containing protein [Streptomyces rimosus]KOT92473.1 hypothetical protein ADK70_15705 [Streptomyces rimosus subsp. pseudoverticillatus]
MGHRLPQDVALVGFGDSAADEVCEPQLTTSRQATAMASGMARTVLRQVEKPRERVRAYRATTTRRPPVITF